MNKKRTTVPRRVKFYYYEVHKISKNKSDVLFNLSQWASCLPKGGSSKERNISSLGETIRCDNIKSEQLETNQYGNFNIDIIHFTKLRSKNNPAVAAINSTDLYDVKLDSDEFIAEDVSMLFDDTNYVAMIQKNIYSLSVNAIQDYINYFWNKDKNKDEYEKIEFRPIFEKNMFNKARRAKEFKSLTLSTADVKDPNSFNFSFTGELGDLIKSFKSFDCLNVSIKISVGRHRRFSLNKESVIDAIDQIQKNITKIKDASVKVSDDDNHSQPIDLINNSFCSPLIFEIPLKTALLPNVVKKKMLAEYMPDPIGKDKMHYIQDNKI